MFISIRLYYVIFYEIHEMRDIPISVTNIQLQQCCVSYAYNTRLNLLLELELNNLNVYLVHINTLCKIQHVKFVRLMETLPWNLKAY